MLLCSWKYSLVALLPAQIFCCLLLSYLDLMPKLRHLLLWLSCYHCPVPPWPSLVHFTPPPYIHHTHTTHTTHMHTHHTSYIHTPHTPHTHTQILPLICLRRMQTSLKVLLEQSEFIAQRRHTSNSVVHYPCSLPPRSQSSQGIPTFFLLRPWPTMDRGAGFIFLWRASWAPMPGINWTSDAA